MPDFGTSDVFAVSTPGIASAAGDLLDDVNLSNQTNKDEDDTDNGDGDNE